MSALKLDNPILFLATANATASRAFYERALGLEFVADEPPALVFRVGDSMLRIQKVERVHAAPYTLECADLSALLAGDLSPSNVECHRFIASR